MAKAGQNAASCTVCKLKINQVSVAMFIWDTLNPEADLKKLSLLFARSWPINAMAASGQEWTSTNHQGFDMFPTGIFDMRYAMLLCCYAAMLLCCYAVLFWLPPRPKRQWRFPLLTFMFPVTEDLISRNSIFNLIRGPPYLTCLLCPKGQDIWRLCSKKSQGANDSELNAQNSINSENQWFVGLCMLDYERKRAKDWEAANHRQPKKKRALNS